MEIVFLLKAGAIMAFCMAGLSGIPFLVSGHRLFRYLHEHHFEIWKSLPYPGGGPASCVKGMRFLFGLEGCGDKEVWRMKITVRNSYTYTFTGLVAAFVIGFLAAALEASGGQQ